MSRAFTREDDNENAVADLGERPVSPHRNLVTEMGLTQIDETIRSLHEDLAKAEPAADRQRIAVLSRDLRYWISRRENAEVSIPDPDIAVVRFGMTITIEGEDGRKRSWKIVGEDEADAAKGSISHVSPMAQALFGKSVGDVVTVGDKEWEITDL
ncbi:MAG: transcription elongation factor GreA [Mesorhizobium sp.]|nr:transcription elongation factor GreA [Mesorhizobium sp.]MBL8578970.1 transcription elongation factor GreA [Mesorhizobium sp.]